MYFPSIFNNFILHLVKFLDYRLRQNRLLKQNIRLKYINCLFHKIFKTLYIQRSTKKVIFAAEFNAMCFLLADFPVIKFSGACKIFATTRTLDGNEILSGAIQMQFSLQPPPLPLKERHLEISCVLYMLYNCQNRLLLTKEEKGSSTSYGSPSTYTCYVSHSRPDKFLILVHLIEKL